MKKIPVLFSALFVSTILVSACVPVGIASGVAASTGIAAGQEGGLKSAVSDTGIRARINDYWFKYDTEMFSKVNLTVDQGRVLLTGVVQKPEHRVEAVRLAWQAKGVKQVINEIQVGNERSFGTFAKDKWISSQLRTEMILNKNIQSINYTVDTVRGTVYLMGVAQNQTELTRVINIARKTKGVKQVVSYVKMTGEKIVPMAKGSETDGGNTSVMAAPVETVPMNTNSSPSSTTYSPSGIDTSMPASAPPLAPSSSDVQSEVLPP